MITRLSGYSFGIALMLCLAIARTGMADPPASSAVAIADPTGPVTASSRSSSVNVERLIPTQIASFRVVLGRLELSPECFRIGSMHERRTLPNGHEHVRSVSVSVKGDHPTLTFSDRGNGEDWTVHFGADGTAQIELVTMDVGSGKRSGSVKYLQPAFGPVEIRLTFADGRPESSLKIPSLWHLVIFHRATFENHLQHIMQRLEPNWDLAETADYACQLLESGQVPSADADLFTKLIEGLDSPELHQRTLAYHQLESAGLVVHQQLMASLDDRLSHHQRLSIRRLIDRSLPMGGDDSVRVALWMSGQRR